MDKKTSTKKRSGYDFKKMREESECVKSAKLCRKLTDMFHNMAKSDTSTDIDTLISVKELPPSYLITNDDIVLDIVNALNINEGDHGNIAEIVMGEDNDCNVPSQYESDLQEHSPIPTLTNLSEELPANEMMTETHCSYSEEKDVDVIGLAENLIDLTFKFPSDPFNL